MEKWNGNYIDTNTGELIEALEDEKYNWRQKRRGVARMGKLYKLIKRPDKDSRIKVIHKGNGGAASCLLISCE